MRGMWSLVARRIDLAEGIEELTGRVDPHVGISPLHRQSRECRLNFVEIDSTLASQDREILDDLPANYLGSQAVRIPRVGQDQALSNKGGSVSR